MFWRKTESVTQPNPAEKGLPQDEFTLSKLLSELDREIAGYRSIENDLLLLEEQARQRGERLSTAEFQQLGTIRIKIQEKQERKIKIQKQLQSAK